VIKTPAPTAGRAMAAMTAMTALTALTLLVATPAWSQTTVADPWVRGTVAQQRATGMFATLTSVQGGRLVAASSPVAGLVEIHEMAMSGDVMRMRAVPGIELPPGQPVELKPGGYHVMLMELKQPVGAGQMVPVTLVIEHKDGTRESVEVAAPVRPLGQAGGMMQGHGHRP
jgi:periplasmic copper chaperone A